MKHTLALLGIGMLLTAGGCVQRETTLVGSRAEGDAALRAGEFAAAAASYERYLEERPARREVMYDLGRAYEGMGEMSAAREAYSIAYELDPDNPDFIDAAARATAANGEIEAAFDLLEQIARETERSDAYTRLGRFLLEFGFPDEGVLAYRTAAAIDPDVGVFVDLAGVLADFGDREGALKALSHALWLNSDSRAVKDRIRELGGVPGPTFASPPMP